VDIYAQESLAIEASQSLKGEDVVRVLNRLKEQRGVPKLLFCDNGPEFTGQMLNLWAYRNNVKIDFSRPRQADRQRVRRELQGPFKTAGLSAA
jgi:putative transposase